MGKSRNLVVFFRSRFYIHIWFNFNLAEYKSEYFTRFSVHSILTVFPMRKSDRKNRKKYVVWRGWDDYSNWGSWKWNCVVNVGFRRKRFMGRVSLLLFVVDIDIWDEALQLFSPFTFTLIWHHSQLWLNFEWIFIVWYR